METRSFIYTNNLFVCTTDISIMILDENEEFIKIYRQGVEKPVTVKNIPVKDNGTDTTLYKSLIDSLNGRTTV